MFTERNGKQSRLEMVVLEELVPQDHLLRKIDKAIDLVPHYRHFAFGEYTRALRPVCKHPDLRVGYANRILCALAHRARADS